MKLRNMKTSLSTIKESNNDNLEILEKNICIVLQTPYPTIVEKWPPFPQVIISFCWIKLNTIQCVIYCGLPIIIFDLRSQRPDKGSPKCLPFFPIITTNILSTDPDRPFVD